MQLKTINLTPTFEILQEEGTFQGYASVFNTLDANGDIVVPGCFKSAIQNFDKSGATPKMLWQHDTKSPIGKWTHLIEDSHGLRVSGKLFLDLPKAWEAYTLMKEGELKGLSIGYQVIRSQEDAKTGVTILKQVDLMEISLVTFPANHAARVLECKNQKIPEEADYWAIERIERIINILRES